MVIYALARLPPEYESFITTVTKKNVNLTFEDLRSKLLYHEYQQMNSAASDQSIVATTQQNEEKNKVSRPWKRLFPRGQLEWAEVRRC